MNSLADAVEVIRRFERGSLTEQLGALERQLRGLRSDETPPIIESAGISPTLWAAAMVLKRAAAQVNTLVHGTGVLLALPRILAQDEFIINLSLGAGNTGREFDLETNLRIAEFSFIDWQGGAESIRQNNLFDDFFRLAEAKTEKTRYLYAKGLAHPLQFLQGGRALQSVMSRKESLRARFRSLHGGHFRTVREYYQFRKDRVQLVDLLQVVPELAPLAG